MFNPIDLFDDAADRIRIESMKTIQENIAKIILKNVKLTTALVRIQIAACGNNIQEIKNICAEVMKR